jgi:hypothetical protein
VSRSVGASVHNALDTDVVLSRALTVWTVFYARRLSFALGLVRCCPMVAGMAAVDYGLRLRPHTVARVN